MNILIICVIALAILQAYILKVKWTIYSTWTKYGRQNAAEKLYKSILGFSPKSVGTVNYETMMDAMCAHLGTETYYQDGLPNFKVTLRRILWKMSARHVLNWKAFPKRSVIASLLFCLPLMVSAQDVNVSAYFGGTTITQEDPYNYDMETGLIGGLSSMVAWNTLYVEASVLRESHDFNNTPSFKGYGVELSAGWTTKEGKWRVFVGPYYRAAFDTGKMDNYGVQTQIQYGPIFGKGQLGFYDYQQYTGYSGVAAVGVRLQL